ncbi:MAG TPA: hypothetical protein DCZ44_06115 [Flavobacteriaceae bacterium]|mgnify:FL=1|nr:hypothetical protein [Flavobacteriaceae bacterium]
MVLENELFLSLGYCGFMLALFLIFQAFPPKKINHIYGYRTARSMANETVWKDANNYSMKLGVQLGLWGMLLPLFYYFIWPEQLLLATVITHTGLLLLIVIGTERYLDQRYDKKGQPKNTTPKD